MVNKQTINFNCGQLKQLIVKTINFLEALVQSSECIGMKGEISEVVIIIDKVIDYYMC